MMTSLSGSARTRNAIAAAIILTTLALLAYANTFNAPFIYDDTNNILNNSHIRMTAVTVDSIRDLLKGPSAQRPLSMLTIAFNYYSGRYDVRGYHAVNLSIHLFTAGLLFLVARQTLRLCGSESNLAPLLAAALWLVNPVHTQSVTYIIQRMNSLAAMFYMLALFSYIQARIMALAGERRVLRRLLYALCLIAGLCGLGSKPIAATLPIIIFLYEWYFFQNLDRAWLKKQFPWIGLAIMVIIVLAVLYLGTSPMDKILRAYQKHDFTPGQRLLTEPGAVIYYICLLLFPHPNRLALIYDFPFFTSILTPLTTLIAMLGISALVLAGILLSKKQRLLSFSIFWFLGNLVIESSIFGLALVFEHRTYLPSVFPFIALTALIIKPRRTRIPSVVLLCALIAVCGVWTHQRNVVWNDGIRFWRDNAAKAPNDTTVHNNLGQALLVAGEIKQAEIHFNRAIAIAPDCDHYNNLGLAMMKTGDMERATAFFYQALRYSPCDANTHFNLGTACFQKQDLDRACHHLQQAARFDPHPALALNNLAAVLVIQKKYEEAANALTRLADLRPENAAVHYNLACVYALQGKKETAVAALKKAVGLGYNRWGHMKTDPDLENIHDTDYFKNLIVVK